MSYPGLDAVKLRALESLGLTDAQLKIANDQALAALKDELRRMTINRKNPKPQWKGETLNLVLLGKTGAGKSAVANLVSGTNDFLESHSSESCTTSVQHAQSDIGDVKVNIIDTPGLMDTSADPEDIITEIAKVFDKFREGIHALLFVYSCGNPRFTKEEEAAFAELKEGLLGQAFLDNCFIVMTHGHDISKKKSLDQYLDAEKQSKFGQLLNEHVNKRVILVDTTETTQYGKEGQKRQVIEMITSHLLPTDIYTNDALQQYQEEQKKLVQDYPVEIRPMNELIDELLFRETSHLSGKKLRKLNSSKRDDIIQSVTQKVQQENSTLPPDQLRTAVTVALNNKIQRYTQPSFLAKVKAFAMPILKAAGNLIPRLMKRH